MSSIRDFDQTLATLTVTDAGDYVYCTDCALPSDVTPFAVINESPSPTCLVSVEDARRNGCDDSTVFTRLVLDIEDSLDTPGLIAAVSQNLASLSITCNVVTGFHHAHAFVPKSQAADAIHVLEELSRQAQGWVAVDIF